MAYIANWISAFGSSYHDLFAYSLTLCIN